MKSKRLIITALIFFLLVNTTYFWEEKIGILAIVIFFILFIIYILLVIKFIVQLYFSIREKFRNKQRLIILIGLMVIIVSTFFSPEGLIDFDKLEGADVLVASRAGGGDCSTILKFKENNKFVERTICFEVNSVRGSYKIKNDTIYFEKTNKKFYKHAVIKKINRNKNLYHVSLVRYKNLNDTIGHELYITKNILSNIKIH